MECMCAQTRPWLLLSWERVSYSYIYHDLINARLMYDMGMMAE